jgi:uncharacterized protein (DUF849 family)
VIKGWRREDVLIKAAINGGRVRAEHSAIPITPEQQAKEAAGAVAAGAGAIHVRGSDGRESLAPDDIARALAEIHAACPGTPVGVSTGAWIAADASQRLSLVRGWNVLPDFASVNVHEDGAIELIRLLLDRGVGVEGGVWNAQAAQTLRGSGLAHECLRVLIEPAEDGGDAMTNFKEIEAALGQVAPSRLLHGLGASAWEFVALAAQRGYDTRTGLEDTLTLPDGSVAKNNAALVTAALRIVAKVDLR